MLYLWNGPEFVYVGVSFAVNHDQKDLHKTKMFLLKNHLWQLVISKEILKEKEWEREGGWRKEERYKN